MTDEKNAKANSDVYLYSRLLDYVKPYWIAFAISVFGYLCYSLATVLVTDLIQFVLDALGGGAAVGKGIVSGFMLSLVGESESATTETARYLIPIALMFIALLRAFGSFTGQYFIELVARNVVHTLRCEIFDKLLVMPNAYFDRNSSGNLISKITYNTEQLAHASTNALQAGIREVFTAAGLLAFMLYLNWRLCVVFLIVAPLIIFLIVKVNKFFRRYSSRLQQSMGDVTEVTREMVLGNRVVRLFGGQRYESDRFQSASTYNKKQSLKLTLTGALLSPAVQWLMALSLALLFWLALDPNVIGDLTAGQFASFVLAAGQLPKPIRQLTNLLGHVQRGLAACDDIFQLLDEPVEVDDGEFSVEKVKGEIAFNNVCFSYPESDELALDHVSFTVQPGETVALVGRSGGGKSTLVNMLARFYRASSGEILLDGKNINEYTLMNLRHHISFVSQHVTLFNDTVYNNIAYGALAEYPETAVYEAAKAAHASEFITQLADGFQTNIGDEGMKLSGGQRQRLAIARSLLKDAPILILDEATSALDNESELYIQAALEKVMKGRTTFVIAHRLSTIENADRILVIDNGRIVEQGKHDTLLAADKYYTRLYNRQFDD